MKHGIRRLLALALAAGMILTAGTPVLGADGAGQTLGASGSAVTPFGTPDLTPPRLVGVTLDRTEVEAPGTLTVTVDATDDLSGVDHIGVRFENPENGREISATINDKIWNSETSEWESDGIFEEAIDISEFEPSGRFVLTYARIADRSGNYQYYVLNPSDGQLENGYLPLGQETAFTVLNGSGSRPDLTPPRLVGITLDRTEVEAPGSLTVTVDATDDISGVDHIGVRFENPENGREISATINDKIWNPETSEWESDGIFEEAIDISEFEPSGRFVLTYARVADRSGNYQYYVLNPDKWELENGYLPLEQETAFTVINGEGSGLITSTENPHLAQDIRNTPDGSKTSVYYGRGASVGQDVFEAIQGTDKTVSFESSGIQWVFEGCDITQPKAIDLSVDIDRVEESSSDSASRLEELTGGQNTVVLSFPENGILPGKATIRVKVDPNFRDYLRDGSLYVYYYDRAQDKLICVAEDLDAGADGYVEFTITHNSDFIITGDLSRLPTAPDEPDSSHNTGTSSGNSGSWQDASGQLRPRLVITKAGMQARLSRPADPGAPLVIENADEIQLAALQLAAQSQRRLYLDTRLENGSLLGRVYVDPQAAERSLMSKLSISAGNRTLSSLGDDIRLIRLAQDGELGLQAEIAVKLDWDGMNGEQWYIYRYDPSGVRCIPLPDAQPWMDQNGFLHFSVQTGGTFVIAKRTLF